MSKKRKEHRRRRWVAARPRVCALGVTLACMACVLGYLFFAIHTVTVRDSEGFLRVVRTAYTEPEEILRAVDAPREPYDMIECSALAGGAVEISVVHAFPVSVIADGETYTANVNSGTVADLLSRVGVTVGADDEVTPALATPVTFGMEPVRVVRVEYVEQRHRITVPYTVEDRDDTKTTEGQYVHEELFQTGRDGLIETVWRRTYKDGAFAGSEKLDTIVIEEMLPEVHRTFRTNALSLVPAPEGVTVENNVPSSYKEVYSMRSTGYWSPRGRGASGLGLYCGTFACNPNVIPYGTKVYVTSPDGSFVYGWAIATDTGTFAITNPMQIDLFYESYAESAAHGVKQVNVYIMEDEADGENGT